eukprot:4141477-Amphidinium_carterae.1
MAHLALQLGIVVACRLDAEASFAWNSKYTPTTNYNVRQQLTSEIHQLLRHVKNLIRVMNVVPLALDLVQNLVTQWVK